MKNNLQEILIETLKQDERFVTDEWILLKNTIRQKAEELDSELISLVIENEKLRGEFFIDIKEYKVFNASKFIQFINNKEFLPDSYTSFKNKIWLTNKKGDFIAESNEVVLSFPYKDCVLAGGQDKEDTKRNEVFYNEILGRDEIDRLLDDKVFTNFKRIDKDWEHELDSFNRDSEINKARGLPEDTITDNLIIKWNNLLALHSLKKNFAGKVKLIYIDPPYNTDSAANTFKYNNRFNHSTWLTFMKNRLEIAKQLLNEDGIIIIDIDHFELFYLGVIADEIFGIENRIWVLAVQHNPGWRDNEFFANSHENKIIYAKNKNLAKIIDFSLNDTDIKKYTKKDDIWEYKEMWLQRTWDGSKREDRPNLFYPIYFNPKNWEISTNIESNFSIEILPIDEDWVERRWRWGKNRVELLKKTELIIKKIKNNYKVYTKNRLDRENSWIKPKTLWVDSKYAWTTWTKEIKDLFWDKIFNYPKSAYMVLDTLKIASNPWDIVLDYHLWSGTTASVAHKIGRQYIWVEQMDYIRDTSVERLKKVISWDDTSISKALNWKGGWEFVYMEIMEQNGAYVERINWAKSGKELVSIWEEIKESGFVNYYVNTKSVDVNIEEFQKLSLDEQKAFLMEILDKNLLYMNYSEMRDENNGITTMEKDLNDNFYKG